MDCCRYCTHIHHINFFMNNHYGAPRPSERQGSYYERKFDSSRGRGRGGYRGRDHFSGPQRGRGRNYRDRDFGGRDHNGHEYRDERDGQEYRVGQEYRERESIERERELEPREREQRPLFDRERSDRGEQRPPFDRERSDRSFSGRGAHRGGAHGAHRGGRGSPNSFGGKPPRTSVSGSTPQRSGSAAPTYVDPWILILQVKDAKVAGRMDANYRLLEAVNKTVAELRVERHKLARSLQMLDTYAKREALNVEICSEKLDEFTYL